MQEATQAPPGLWEALQRSSSRKPPSGRLLSSFEGGISMVVESSNESNATASILKNKFDLLCPRSDCGSIILKAGVACMTEREAVKIEPEDIQLHPLLPRLPDSSSSWWLITPSPMQFENIGFSKPVDSLSLSPSGKKVKLLACAECDLGPLGWSEEGGSEFYLACSRVAYRNE